MNEKQYQRLLLANTHLIEDGLVHVGSEVSLESGRADLIFKDKNGKFLLIELKTHAESATEPQINRYAADYVLSEKVHPESIRRMIIAFNLSEKLRTACQLSGIEFKQIRNVDLISLEPIKEEIVVTREITKTLTPNIEQPLKVSWHDAYVELNQDISWKIANKVHEKLQQLLFKEIGVYEYDQPNEGKANHFRIHNYDVTVDLLPTYIATIEHLINEEISKKTVNPFRKTVKITCFYSKICLKNRPEYFDFIYNINQGNLFRMGHVLKQSYYEWAKNGYTPLANFEFNEPEQKHQENPFAFHRRAKHALKA